jgi:hypothetical protein
MERVFRRGKHQHRKVYLSTCTDARDTPRVVMRKGAVDPIGCVPAILCRDTAHRALADDAGPAVSRWWSNAFGPRGVHFPAPGALGKQRTSSLGLWTPGLACRTKSRSINISRLGTIFKAAHSVPLAGSEVLVDASVSHVLPSWLCSRDCLWMGRLDGMELLQPSLRRFSVA